MGTPTVFSTHAGLVALAVGTVLALRSTLKDYYAKERRALQMQSAAARIAELADYWNVLTYTNVDRNALGQMLGRKLTGRP